MKLSKPQEYIITSTQDVNLFLAGVGSGKTHLGGFISGYLLQKFPKVFGFLGANTYQQLTTSTLFRVREVWFELFGWKEGRDYVVGKMPPKGFSREGHNFDDYNALISFKWGAVAFKGSLDNAKSHDGKEFGWAILDETKDSREQDVKDVIFTRLRKPGIYIDPDGQLTDEKVDDLFGEENKAFNPLYILTSPAKVAWLNEWFKLDDYEDEIQGLIYDKDKFFIKEVDGKCTVISSTYHNEQNLPKGYIERIISNQSEEGGKRLIYGNPFVKAGGEFYAMFERMVQVKKCEFNPKLPIHISFDQNVNPYMTMTLYQTEQIGKTLYIRQFDEICLPNPNNKTSKVCLEFIRRYGSRCNGLFYYGDPTGRKSDTRGSEHDYDIVKRMLRKYLNNRSERVPYKHPGVLKRKDFINNIFEGLYDVRFEIDPRCKKSIADFEFVKEDINGKKLKEKTTGDNGVQYEKYGHTSDSFDYFICELLKRLFEREFR